MAEEKKKFDPENIREEKIPIPEHIRNIGKLLNVLSKAYINQELLSVTLVAERMDGGFFSLVTEPENNYAVAAALQSVAFNLMGFHPIDIGDDGNLVIGG